MQYMHKSHISSAPSFRSRLPPLHALEVFVIAARSGTFSAAARELRVTQGAVSRQIQQLEDYLGLPLFVRHKSGLTPTPEAQTLLTVAEDTFQRVAQVCGHLRTAGQVLTLKMPPTLATRWFLPLLPSLQLALPDMDVRMTTYDAWQPRFKESDVDAAIIQGKGDWPDVDAIPLMTEKLTPVCSPEMARALPSPEALEHVPLLHCDPLNAWSLWLELTKTSHVAPHRGQTFDTLDLALSAATRGQGVAMGDINLVRESLADGILVQPFDFVLDRGVSYYLVYPSERGQLPKIRALREWLLEMTTRPRP